MALTFTMRRREPELVGPAVPTPHDTKRLSDIDDQETVRSQAPSMFFYRGGPHAADDSAGVIRRALGEALVPYYPIAGRLREVEGRKLVVDCTGEGVMFVEADADVRLAALEAAGLTPPFPCADQLLFDVEGSGGILNCPLLLIQVTRLLCGGFVFALRLNHAICDAIGITQFLTAVSELARGLPAPTVAPSWSRELLEARNPPRPTFPHHKVFDAAPPTAAPPPPPPVDMATRTFTFLPSNIDALRKRLPPNLRDTATTFELLAAALWRARTAALELSGDEHVRLMFICNIRGMPELGLPAGYYGNAAAPTAALVTVEALLAGTLGDTVELVRKAKAAVTVDYVRSILDLLVLRGRPYVAVTNLFVVSDNRRTGFHGVDFGWGPPVFDGPTSAMFGGSYVLGVRNGGDGENNAAALPIMLPRPAMDRFASELEKLLKVV
ncbi:hypothetical protein HU200_009199 [Digitaria exilis]|uniref:Uncharacterized protein n=1 Tax=Digitaria exilis TaxID=1010633 RepID=A0A835KPM8_9POAL|nr:hypothetical protein HU200_009199 [Digitaria exilis]